jgi:hypothetical protein
MLVIGKPGTAGVAKGVLPVLDGDVVVARWRLRSWRESGAVTIRDRDWEFGRRGRELTGRPVDAPEDTVRFSARMTNFWRGEWSLDLDGTAVEGRTLSVWRGTRRYTGGGRVLAESGNSGRWLRRPTLEADPSLSLEAQVFLLWVEYVIRQRSGGAAAGAAVAGGAAGAA